MQGACLAGNVFFFQISRNFKDFLIIPERKPKKIKFLLLISFSFIYFGKCSIFSKEHNSGKYNKLSNSLSSWRIILKTDPLLNFKVDCWYSKYIFLTIMSFRKTAPQTQRTVEINSLCAFGLAQKNQVSFCFYCSASFVKKYCNKRKMLAMDFLQFNSIDSETSSILQIFKSSFLCFKNNLRKRQYHFFSFIVLY